jgi:hypothetical protein
MVSVGLQQNPESYKQNKVFTWKYSYCALELLPFPWKMICFITLQKSRVIPTFGTKNVTSTFLLSSANV